MSRVYFHHDPFVQSLKGSGAEIMAATKKSKESMVSRGAMTVREAGRKGGEVTAERHGPQFYEEIGRKGGQKVKRLIEQGKRAEG
jgi:general stress protein YciG